jgi:DNA-binding response OmpR family regulator
MNVLLVDDEPNTLSALSALLEDLGAELHCAHSGEEALRQVLKHDYAAIVLDVRMPGIDGFETAAAIRSVQRVSRTPIIFLSPHGDRRAGRRDPLCEFLVKPLDPAVLRPRLAAHLGRRRLSRPRSAPARRPG